MDIHRVCPLLKFQRITTRQHIGTKTLANGLSGQSGEGFSLDGPLGFRLRCRGPLLRSRITRNPDDHYTQGHRSGNQWATHRAIRFAAAGAANPSTIMPIGTTRVGPVEKHETAPEYESEHYPHNQDGDDAPHLYRGSIRPGTGSGRDTSDL